MQKKLELSGFPIIHLQISPEIFSKTVGNNVKTYKCAVKIVENDHQTVKKGSKRSENEAKQTKTM